MEARDRFQQNIKDKYDTVKEEIQERENKEHEIEREGDAMQRALLETTDDVVPEEEGRGRQRWMAQEILHEMGERN